jgi:FAD/FMN-containing dehydrogenase
VSKDGASDYCGRGARRRSRVGHVSPDYYCMDGTIPRRCSRACSWIEALSAEYELRCASVFHAGDGNLPAHLRDANIADETKRAEAFGATSANCASKWVERYRRARRRHRNCRECACSSAASSSAFSA